MPLTISQNPHHNPSLLPMLKESTLAYQWQGSNGTDVFMRHLAIKKGRTKHQDKETNDWSDKYLEKWFGILSNGILVMLTNRSITPYLNHYAMNYIWKAGRKTNGDLARECVSWVIYISCWNMHGCTFTACQL